MKIRKLITLEMTTKEENAFFETIKGNLSSRELGKIVGLSHQGALNAITNFVKQKYQEGKLIIK
ncbi:MAG: hypothetical protein WC549_04585 [Actinomycetota bacterium]